MTKAGGKKTLLVQPPAFSRTPSNALALLHAHLKAAGLSAFVRDSSLAVWDGFEKKGIAPKSSKPLDSQDFLDLLRSEPKALERALDREARFIVGQKPDVVGFSLLTLTDELGLDLARRVKRLSPEVCVVVGGPQCLRETLAHDLIRDQSVDAVAMGEADVSLVSFVKSFDLKSRLPPRTAGFLIKEAGTVVDCGDPIEVEDLDSLPFLDFAGFDMARYSTESLHLATTRGCVRRCTFCTHILQQKTFRTMSARRTAAEIRHQLDSFPDRHYVEFGDSLVNGNVSRLGQLVELLAELRLERAAQRKRHDLNWGGMAILHPTMTAAFLRKMRWGGCRRLSYGLESASQKVVDSMGKGFRVADAEKIVRDTARAGIDACVFIMVGFPGETEEDFRRTIDFLKRNADFIGGVFLSSCEIQKGSALDAERELRGVLLPGQDRANWVAADGSSTPEIRRRRYREVEALRLRLGLPGHAHELSRVSGLEQSLQDLEAAPASDHALPRR